MEQPEKKTNSLKEVWNTQLKSILLNKYFIVLVFFGIVILFASDYSMFNRMKNKKEIKRIEAEIAAKRRQIEQNKKRIYELQSDRDNLEKFAREHYLMKQDDEVIYLIEE